jgi:beta-lactamase regulating signal transducer with metallopeptidase domain
MDPSVGLLAASGLVNFLLKTSLEFLVCLLLVRVAGSARSRFNLWLTMLVAFMAQWIWMWAGVLRAAFPAEVRLVGAAANSHAAAGKRIAIAVPTAGTVAQVVAVLLAIYVAMVAWRVFGTLAARLRMARAMRYKTAPEAQIAATFQEVAEETSATNCELWVLPGVSSPATLGWLRPRVIVPPVCQTQDEAELKAVFWHELKHVERRDALWNAMVRACRNLLWFHPAVHHAIEALNAQRELACDAAVVREHPQSRDVYASCLLRFARMADFAPEPVVPTIEMASSAALLTMRVRSILSEGPRMSRLSRAARATTNVLVVGAMAATVPGLNILFAADQARAVVQMPMAARSSFDAPVARKRHVFRTASASVPSLAARPAVSGEAANSAAMQHDEVVAAEHRAAMGILTESTGMDAPATAGEGRGSLKDDPGHATAVRSSTSWTSIATDSLARMAPMAGDHDHDGHH